MYTFGQDCAQVVYIVVDDGDDGDDDDDDDDCRYAPASTALTASQQMVHALVLPAGLESFAKNHVERGGKSMIILKAMTMLMMMLVMLMMMMLMISASVLDVDNPDRTSVKSSRYDSFHCRYGKDCRYECRCKNGAKCDPTSGQVLLSSLLS